MSNETLSAFLQILLQSVVAVAVPVLTAMVVSYVRAKMAEIKGQVPAEVLATIDLVADMVVAAAEQSGLKDEIMAQGENKKAWAMQYGEELLREQLGLFLDLDKLGASFWDAILSGLDMEIEAKVYRLGANPSA